MPVSLLERPRQLSQSLLWKLQARYFADRGVEAWRRAEVPHYLTSNPTVADSYAEITFSFLRDRVRLAGAGRAPAAPIYICELGAGSGRFAFHFLSRLMRLCDQAGVAPAAFKYVLTDAAEANLRFWLRHPRLQPFFERGLLDLAAFDVASPGELELHLGGAKLRAADLEQPLVVIANYLFDSIPQDLLYVGKNGECEQCMVSLTIDEDPARLSAAQLLERLSYHYERHRTEVVYDEPWLQELVSGYRNALRETYLLFPAPGLRCLHRLRALSSQGLLLLSADKGEHRLSMLQAKGPPALARHGSFSLTVNYHAIKAFCERNGGLAMFPEAPHASLNVSACLMVPEAKGHTETLRACARHVQEFSPDDFYTIVSHAGRTIGSMSVEEILAYLRLSRYDAHQLGRYLPRLIELAPGFGGDQYHAVIAAVDRVWSLYFPLGEKLDVANGIARLLYEMNDYRGALEYFRRSIEIYGADTGTMSNMAMCRRLLGQEEQAQAAPIP
jgi:hypothetical protein